MYMYMCIYIYIYMYISTYMYIYIYIYMHTQYRIMNEHTATALEYGFFRSAKFDAAKPKTVPSLESVFFCDICMY